MINKDFLQELLTAPTPEDLNIYKRMGLDEYVSPTGARYPLAQDYFTPPKRSSINRDFVDSLAVGEHPDVTESKLPPMADPDQPLTHFADPVPPTGIPNIVDPQGLTGDIKRPGGEDPVLALKQIKGLARGAENVIGTVGSMAQWVAERASIGDILTRHTDLPYGAGVIAEYLVRKFGPKKPAEFFDKKMKKYAKQGEKWADFWEEQSQKGWEAPDPEVTQAKWRDMPITKGVATISEAAPNYLAAITSSVLTKSPQTGLLFISALSGSGAYRRQRKAGAGVRKANAIATLTGAWEYITEKVPFDEVFKPAKSKFLKMLKLGTLESAQEFVQGIGENFLEYFGYKAKDLKSVPAAVKEGLAHTMDNWVENVVAGAGLGVIGGGMIPKGGLATKPIVTPEQAIQPRTPDKGVELPQKEDIEHLEAVVTEILEGIKAGDTFEETGEIWEITGLGTTAGGGLGIVAETPTGKKTTFTPGFIRGKLAKPEAVEVAKVQVFHGTRAEIEAFRPLSHFGTEKAAERALESVKGKGEAKIISAELTLKNPLEVKDTVGTQEDVVDWIWQAEDKGVVTEEEATVIENIVTKEGEIEKAETAFVKLLKSKGYDGLKYINKTEDKGSISYVIFDPKQVKKAQPVAKAEPIEQNFTQFATEHGYPSDYDITDHSMLSPSGKVSKRAKTQGMKRLEERIRLNKQAHREYNEAILKGEIIDPTEGFQKVTKEGLEKRIEEKRQKEISGRIAQIDAQIRFAKDVGKGKRGIKPTAQKRIDELEAEKKTLTEKAEPTKPEKPLPSPAERVKKGVSKIEAEPAKVEKPAKPKKKSKAEVGQALKEHYTPGNIVYVSYWRTHDRVVDFKETDIGWEVTVEKVEKQDGKWVAVGRKRKHFTAPSKGDKVVERVAPKEPAKVVPSEDSYDIFATNLERKGAARTPKGIDYKLVQPDATYRPNDYVVERVIAGERETIVGMRGEKFESRAQAMAWARSDAKQRDAEFKGAEEKAFKEIKDVEKETITEPTPSPEVEPGKAGKIVPTGKLDPTKPEEALKLIEYQANWVAGGWRGEPRNVWYGIYSGKEVEYTPEQIDTAYRTVQKPVESPMPDTDLFAMPGKEAQMKAIAQKMAKVKGVVKAKKMGPKPLTKPTALPKAKTKIEDHIKAVYVAADKDARQTDLDNKGRKVVYAIGGVKVEGDIIVATDGRRMFWAKGEWGKDGLYINAAALKKGLLGKPTKEKINFPKWKDIVPEVSRRDAILVEDLETILRHVRQAASVTTEESKGITIIENKDGSLGFAAAAPEVGHVEVWVNPGGKILGAVNPQYLMDAIKFHAIRGNPAFEFYFSDPTRPILTKSFDGKTNTVTMPINVGEPSEAITKAISEGKPPEQVKPKGKRVISEESYQKAKKRLTDRTTLRMGVEPQGFADLVTIGAYHVENGLRTFVEWSKKMIEVYGESVKPQLQKIWNQVKPLNAEEVEAFPKEFLTEQQRTKAEMGEIPSEGEYKSLSVVFNEHLDYFQKRQLPKTSRIPKIQAMIRTINGQRLAGKVSAKAANKAIIALRQQLFLTARDEGVALRMTRGGKVSLSVRKAGTYVPEEFAEYGKFKNIRPILGGGQDITRAIQQMDGSLSVKGKLRVKGQAGPLERHVLWPTRDISIQKLNYIKEKTAELKSIFKTKKGSKEDEQVNLVLEQIAKEDRDTPIKDILSRKTLRAIASPKVIQQAIGLREYYDNLIEEQNLAREMRDQDTIPYRHNYSPHILRDTTIWERLMMTGKKPKDIKADLPDYIKPNAPFNPRAMAREAGIEYEKRVKSAQRLAESYLVTASKDIFNTSIVQNNKAFIQQLESQGYDKSANYLADWTAEAYAGIKPRLDRAIQIGRKAEKSARYFNRLRNMAVFPLNFSWSLLTQTSSLALTVGRYGTSNTMRGFVQWLNPKIRKQAAEDYYSYVVKAERQGKITRQDAQNLIGVNVKLRRTKTEIAHDISTLLLDQLEKLLTGTSIRAARLHGKKRGLTGEALKNYASDGGAKTQSMYNDEDKPALLRNLLVKTGAPYQTFAYEVVNTMREWAGRTGTPPDTKLYTIWTIIRFLAAASVFAAIGKKYGNKEIWSWKRPPIPFAEFWLNPIVKMFSNQWIGSASGLTSPVGTATRVAKGIEDVLETGSWRKLRNELTKYGPGILGVPGGIQISRTVDAIIAYAQGGVKDRKGRLLFEMEDPQDLVQAIFSGVWSTEGGRAYLDIDYKIKNMTLEELKQYRKDNVYQETKVVKLKDGTKVKQKKKEPHKGREKLVEKIEKELKIRGIEY